MKDKTLMTITPGKNKAYIEAFNRVILDRSYYLSNSDFIKIYPNRPIIGQILKPCFDFETVLRLKRLEKVKETDELVDKYSSRRVKKTWLVTRNIAEGYGLSIGSINNGVEIFREVSKNESYFLASQWSEKRTEWIEPPPEFIKETRDLLPEDVQLTFKKLVETQITK